MNIDSILFFGPSGSGKGTQADLLKKVIEEKSGKQVKVFSVGNTLRSFIQSDGLVSQKMKELYETGELAPVFFPIWAWSDFLIHNVNKDDVVIFDGVGRRKAELEAFEGILKLVGRVCTTIVLDIPDQVATMRLQSRDRSDDKLEAIKERLQWYKQEVEPAIAYAKTSDQFSVLEIDGTPSIQEIHINIISNLNIN